MTSDIIHDINSAIKKANTYAVYFLGINLLSWSENYIKPLFCSTFDVSE